MKEKAIEQYTQLLKDGLPDLEESYHVKQLGVFGSAARGEMREKSDVDILVEFSEPIGMFKFIDLERRLSDALSKKVDLVTKDALKPSTREQILNEVIYV